ncbi:MAG: STAS domain-containing protein [Pseudomonadota bacterium]
MKAKLDRDGEKDFHVTGDMTFATARKLLVESKNLFEKSQRINLHLGRVERADSAGLALLLEWLSQAERMGGELIIDGIPESILAIARLCQVDRLLETPATANHAE